MKTFLGIDVGSITTKLVLIDTNSQVLFPLYLRTSGNPIGTIQGGLRELNNKIKIIIPTSKLLELGLLAQLVI